MMRELNAHLSDKELLLFADGETQGREEADIRDHLAGCCSCQLRMRELDEALGEAATLHRQATQPLLPPIDGARARLRAGLREAAASGPNSGIHLDFRQLVPIAASLAAVGILLGVIGLGTSSSESNAIPRSDLTPGAVRSVSAKDVCRADLSGNADVIPAVQRLVFAEYGMPNAERRAYEVDYLITPALGGSDDIRNLWPQPYVSSPWNAHVKDALEDRLRGMVCNGQLDLATAQHEIAVNWVAAYKKYFHTRRPLPQHQMIPHESGKE
jgi:hypothetical protein